MEYYGPKTYSIINIAPDKDWKQLGVYHPLFGLISHFKLVFQVLYWVSI